jgi:hypothetical protein
LRPEVRCSFVGAAVILAAALGTFGRSAVVMKYFAVCVLAGLLCGTAGANVSTYSVQVDQMVSYTDGYGPAATNWAKVLALPQFDASLGTLTEVHLTLSGSLDASFGYENKREIAQDMSYMYKLDQTMSLSSVGQPSLSMATTRGSTTWIDLGSVGAFDGLVDYAGTSGGTVQYGVLTDSALHTYTGAADLAAFIGTGSIMYDAAGTGYVSMGISGGNSAMKSASFAGATVTVDYIYTVPEPMTLGLLGLGGLLLRRRMA